MPRHPGPHYVQVSIYSVIIQGIFMKPGRVLCILGDLDLKVIQHHHLSTKKICFLLKITFKYFFLSKYARYQNDTIGLTRKFWMQMLVTLRWRSSRWNSFRVKNFAFRLKVSPRIWFLSNYAYARYLNETCYDVVQTRVLLMKTLVRLRSRSPWKSF